MMKERLEIRNKERKKWFQNKQEYIEFAMKAIVNAVKAGYLNRARLPAGGSTSRYPYLDDHMKQFWQTHKVERKERVGMGTTARGKKVCCAQQLSPYTQ